MASRKAGSGPGKPRSSGSVDEFLSGLKHPRKADVQLLRQWILGADARVREEVKWNAPSFFIKEHFATFRLAPRDTLQLVLHTGAKVSAVARTMKVDDPHELLRWAAGDRCVMNLDGVKDIASQREAVTAIVKQWIAQAAV